MGAALGVKAGPCLYKGQAVDVCVASIQMLQKGACLLCPENAQFHKVGSMSDHFVNRLLAAFFRNAMS